MAGNDDNRKRAFADVVAIDAWHDDFEGGVASVDLHADVVFGTARVGGEAESPVRFRLSVRRAEVIVIIPDGEPAFVDKKTVSRDSPEFEGHFTESIQKTVSAKAKGSLTASLSKTGIDASASAEAGADASMTRSNKLEVSATLHFMFVTQSKTQDGHYRWSIESRVASKLEGRPWDALKQPRLRIVDRRKDRTKGIPPSVRVEVRCRREDLIVEDIEVKDQTIWEATKSRMGFKNRMAAAESYIRDRLSEEGLEVKNIDDVFGQLTLGSTTAEAI